MTSSEDLSSPETLSSMSSAKLLETNGAAIGSGGGGNSCITLSTNNLNPLPSTGNAVIRKKSMSSTGDSDVASCSIPFTTIYGEKIQHVVQTADGVLVISNYRLFVQAKDNHFNIPLGLIDQLECRDIFFLHINCKDVRCIRCTFPNNETVIEVMRRIQQTLAASKSLEEHFAFTFFEKVEMDLPDEMKLQLGSDLPPAPTPKERFDAEIKRMEFNVQNPWRVSTENEDYELCSSYPKHIIVPNSIDKKKLEQVACFRSARRFPAVVWRHRGNGAVICRCSQPEVGWFGWRSTEDEELVQNIIQACAYQSNDRLSHMADSQSVPLDSISSPTNFNGGSIELVPEFSPVKKLLILDARSYTTAVANRARGGGCECLEYYPNCEIQFMNLANIHSIRKSFINTRQLCALPSDQANWFSQLEGCKWLQHMSGLMKAAVTVVTAIENAGRPVIVHCSDGWDRTPQIVSLAEILLDPYYRSLEGFEVLVEREWLDFGHKFGDRCGQGVGSEDANERCPVFLQWLDCLHQLIRQFPTAFEFNMSFLVKLAQHTYSNLFGTFLCNTSKERELYKISEKTISVWRFLRATRNYDKFRNSLYKSCDKVLWPSCEVRDLGLWSQVYLGYENPPPSLTEVVNPSQESSPAPSVAEGESLERNYKPHASKGRSSSYENLTQIHPSKGHQRKMSDSSLYGSPDNDTECGMSKDLLTKVTRNEGEDNSSTHLHPELSVQLEGSSLNGAATQEATGDNSENEEDNEPNSEGRSVINLHRLNLKSIESSTDTLVPELGFSADNKVSPVNGDGLFILPAQANGDVLSNGVLHHEENENTASAAIALDSAEVDLPEMEDALNTDVEISLLTSNLNGLGVESSTSALDGPSTEKLLPEYMEDLSNYGGVDNFTGHHCNVCEQSKAVLRHVQNHNNFQIAGSGNPSSSSSGIGTSCYASFNGAMPFSNGMTAVGNNFLLKEKQSWDVDGLTHYHDETQIRLNSILAECQAQIEALQRDVQIYRNALREQVCHRCHCSNNHTEVPDDTVSMSGSEVVSQSSEASSFEAIDHMDTYPPLWVPDFAVTHCMGCFLKFSLGRRKHHCRACGRVYCSDCSENSITLPHEQIFVPSRVCRTCFLKYRPDPLPNSTLSEPVINGEDHSLNHIATGHPPVITRSISVTGAVPQTSAPYFIPASNSHHTLTQANSTKSKPSKSPLPQLKGVDGSPSICMNGNGLSSPLSKQIGETK